MARTEARVKTVIWNLESSFRTLDSSAQRLYLVILSQSDISLCGVAPLAVGRWADMAADTEERHVKKALSALACKRYVVADHHTLEVAVRSFVKNDGVLNGSPKVRAGMVNAFGAIQSIAIRASVQQEVAKIDKPLSKQLVEMFGDYLSIEVPIPVSKAVSKSVSKQLSDTPRARTRGLPTGTRTSLLSPNLSPENGHISLSLTGVVGSAKERETQ